MAGAIWAVTEVGANGLKGVSNEVLACGQKLAEALGKPLEAVVMGAGVRAAAEKTAANKLAALRLIDDPRLEPYTPDGYTAALRQAIEVEQPGLVLFPHTYQVRDWVPRLAGELEAGFVSDVVEYREEDGRIVFVRQPYQGKLNADCAFLGAEPHLVSLQAGAWLASDAAVGDPPAEIVEQAVDLSAVEIRTQVLDTFQEIEDKVDLTRADVIVAVGRGIGKQEKIAVVEDLARALGAQLAASRPVCDNEWLPMDRQIGSSGQTVTPRLYVAVGISGAIQHRAGMQTSKTIVAVNKDPEAPIFAMADFGVVGDLHKVLPQATEEITKRKG